MVTLWGLSQRETLCAALCRVPSASAPGGLRLFSSAEQLMAAFVKAHGRKAKDVMTRRVISVDPDTSLQEIANLLEKHGIKRVPVLKDGRLVGIVSRANLVQALASRGLGFVDVTEADE